MNENKTEKLLKIISKLRILPQGVSGQNLKHQNLYYLFFEETKEIQEAFENNDYENFKELGDLLYK